MYNTTAKSHLSSLLKSSNYLKVYSGARLAHHACKILVVGGGTGGCTMAAKLSRKFDKAPNHVIVIEPAKYHYYQPMFTLVGAGIKRLEQSKQYTKNVVPPKAQWIQDKVVKFQPDKNVVVTSNGDTVKYQLMIVALGIQLYWDQIPGLVEGIKNKDSGVCSIYDPNTVEHVFETIKRTKNGNAIFTFPSTTVKCPGAPQKIAYLAEDYWRQHNRRKDINVMYKTNLPVLFGVKKYADSLWNVCKGRDINVSVITNLTEIDPDKKQATFQNATDPKKVETFKYSMLHVSPPQGPPKELKENKLLVNSTGYLTVNPSTLQHDKYQNIFGIGDCTNTPNSKTMAAIASQAKVLYGNIMSHLDKKEMKLAYNGYASCPLVTKKGKCILAEFDYNLTPLETFPVNQGKEMYFTYFLKAHYFPFLYWNLMLKGYWDGPETFRKILNPFQKTSQNSSNIAAAK